LVLDVPVFLADPPAAGVPSWWGIALIVGTGIDIISVARVHALVERMGDRFLRRWFTEEELAYCMAKARPALHLAARLAAKEALIKALRPAWNGPVLLRDIAVVTEESGAPTLRLAGRAAEIAGRAGVTGLHVSLSHDGDYAVASVIADGGCADSALNAPTVFTPPAPRR
jgi:holo-[acyl-carrier protein] synthase